MSLLEGEVEKMVKGNAETQTSQSGKTDKHRQTQGDHESIAVLDQCGSRRGIQGQQGCEHLCRARAQAITSRTEAM
jgi:hypothetical protein